MNTDQRPTPETDAAEYEAHQWYQVLYPSSRLKNKPVHAAFAKRLEQQRDEAREIAGRLATLLSLSNGLQESEDWSSCYRKTQLQIIHNQLTEYETMSARWKK